MIGTVIEIGKQERVAMKNDTTELKRLATLERDRGDVEIRWSWDEFAPANGQPTKYVSARKWVKDREGKFIPTKSGVTVRVSELDQVVDALQKVQRARDGR